MTPATHCVQVRGGDGRWSRCVAGTLGNRAFCAEWITQQVGRFGIETRPFYRVVRVRDRNPQGRNPAAISSGFGAQHESPAPKGTRS